MPNKSTFLDREGLPLSLRTLYGDESLNQTPLEHLNVCFVEGYVLNEEGESITLRYETGLFRKLSYWYGESFQINERASNLAGNLRLIGNNNGQISFNSMGKSTYNKHIHREAMEKYGTLNLDEFLMNRDKQPQEMNLEALEKKVDELRSSYSLGLTHKSELSPVNEPVNPYLIELIHRRMKNYNTKFLGNEANLSAQELAEEKGYREQSERDFRGLVRKGLDSVRKSSKIRRFFM